MMQFPSVGLRLPELWDAVHELTPAQLSDGSGRPFLVELSGGVAAAMDDATVSDVVASELSRRPWELTRVLLVVKRRDAGEGRITVGRAATNDVVIPTALVSKAHAYFLERDGNFGLADDGSRNGTTIDGEALDPGTPYKLSDGAEIGFGEAVFLFVHPAGFHDAVRRLFPEETA